MSWSNYLVNDKNKIAFEIGKIGYSDVDDEIKEPLNDLLEYVINTEEKEKKIEVINYLFNKIPFIENSNELFVSLFLSIYGISNWKIISENEVTEDYIRIYL